MKFKLIAAALLLLTVSGAGLKIFVFTEERRARHTLLALREKISAPADGGGLDLALYLSALKPFFAPAVSVSTSGGEWQFERDELPRVIASAKRQNPALAVSFAFARRSVTVSGATARADVFVTVQNLNEPIEPQRLLVILERGEGQKWRVAAVETPPENQPQKDADNETEH